MATVMGINIKFAANTAGISKGAERTSQQLRGIQKSADKTTSALRGLVAIEVGKSLASGFAAATRAIASATNMLSGYVDSVRQSSQELIFLAQQAGTNERMLQRMAAATATVGIDQEKLADILKDVNDRVGDFLQTGAGPMADFFEKIAPRIGLTVNAFKGLSGPEALQLYVSSLQKANLNQQEFTFYLEAIASDATRLIPLLKNNGKEMAALGKRAEELGIILSVDQVRAVNEMNRALTMVQKTFQGIIGQVVAVLAPAITDMANEFLRFVQGFQGIGGAGGVGLARAIVDVSLAGIQTFLDIIETVTKSLIFFGEAVFAIGDAIAWMVPGLRAPKAGGGGGGGGWGDNGAVEMQGFGDRLRQTLEETANAARTAFARVRASLDRPQRRGEMIAPRIPQRQMPGVVRGQGEDEFGLWARESRMLMKQKVELEKEQQRKYRDELLAEMARKNEQYNAQAARFEQDRLDKFSELNTKALEAQDIRAGGISQFIALATGREDPALTEAKKQVRELQNISRDIQNLGVLVELTGVA